MTTRRDIYSKKELIVKYLFREKKEKKNMHTSVYKAKYDIMY